MSVKTNIVTVGRRKTSVARVRLIPGNGKITVNKKDFKNYFGRISQRKEVLKPIELVEEANKHDIIVNVRGGGFSGQAGAIRHGIARAFVLLNPENKPILKKEGFLTRDARMKERKKYGQKGARGAFQWTKR
ncbi:MAG: 30S ribosomal protein S9 [Candidatus Marinimicrobia bacterium]|nr:30S ribosomal protein S9 [Candidatus Neomarinimicrobiota bacterium]